MVIFNYEELQKAANKSGLSNLEVLLYCKGNKLPKNKRSKYLFIDKNKVLQGHSFLLNEVELTKQGRPQEYIDQYLFLAAKRSYSLYKMYKYKRLPLSLYPDLNIEAIKYNPLLKCTNNELVFLPEESMD